MLLSKDKYLNRNLVFAAVIFVSAAALALAYIAQYGFGLAPCELCLYQRIPFAFAIVLGLSGLMLSKNRTAKLFILAATGITFLANSAIALYHSGVERQWWRSALEGCRVNFSENFQDQILNTPAVPCDAIPWADPLLGLSMANYNAALCLALALFCAYSLIRMKSGRLP